MQEVKQYLEGRINYLKTTHDKCLKELDDLPLGFERKVKWQLINELYSRYTELQEALNILNGGTSIYGSKPKAA